MELLFLREDTPPTVEGRTIIARVCTYGKAYTIGTTRERIRAGAFKAPLARPSGVVRYRHRGERPGDDDVPDNIYGTVRTLRDEDGSLIAEADMVESDRGDHLLSLVKQGAIRGISMSALVADSRMTRDAAGPIRDVMRVAAFYGVSITPTPAYPDAGVLVVREDPRVVDIEKLQRERAEAMRIRAQLTRDMARWGKPGR